MTKIVTPIKAIEVINESRACIQTLINNHGEDTTIKFIKSLTQMSQKEVEGLLFLLSD